MKILKNRQKQPLFWIIPILFMAGFYFLPMASILGHAFASGSDSLFANQSNWTIAGRAVSFTFYQAFLSTFITLLVGIPSSYLFGRFSFWGKNLLKILSTLPFILPTVVVAAGFTALIGPKGWLNLLLMDILRISTPPIRFNCDTSCGNSVGAA
jgi:thiamine transport system permease protein